MLKYKGRDSRCLTVIVGLAQLAADIGVQLGYNIPPDLDEDEDCRHASDAILTGMMEMGCFGSNNPKADPLEAEVVNGAMLDIVGMLNIVRGMPEYTDVITAGIKPACFS